VIKLNSLVALLLTAGSLNAFAQTSRSLDLTALSPQLQDEIKKQIPSLKSDQFTLADLDSLVRFLVTQEQYDSVQILSETQNNTEIFRLNIGRTRRISALKIKGAKHFSESDIRTNLGVLEKSVFDQQLLIEAGDRIRRMYKDQGFRNTVIDLEFARLSTTEVEVTLKVNEGLQTKVTEVELAATNPEFKSRYESFLRKKLKDEPLTENLVVAVRKDLREQFSERRYLKAELLGPEIQLSADESRAKLIFNVPNSDEFFMEYNGVHEVSTNKIEKALDLDHFFTANPNAGPELATKAKAFYLNEGYARAEVNGEETDGSRPYHRKVILNIREGPRVALKEIRLVGHFSLPEKYYVEFIKDHSTELINKGYYNREGVETGLKNLIIDRQNQGYLRAKVVSSKATAMGPEKDEMVLTVNLDEGPLTVLQSVHFEGNPSFNEAQLLQVVGLKTLEPLKSNELDEAITKIKDFYHNSGFLEMRLINEKEDVVQYNADSTLAEVHFRIYEGPKIQVASILLEGNSLTKDYVIFKELDFKIGDVLTPQLIEESTRRLQRLGHFNSVDIKTLEEKTQISQRTVIVRVLDRDPGLFTLGAGINSERGLTLRGYTGIAYRNILGTGRGASVRLEGNYNISELKYLENKVTAGYLEPYLFDTRMRGRVNYTQATFVSDFTLKQATELKQFTYSVEQDLTSHVLVSYDLWNKAQLRKFPIEQRANCVLDSPNPDLACVPSEELVIVTTGPTIDFDFRDHPFNPTSGTFTRLNAEYSDPLLGSSKEIKYYRAFASFTHYKSFFRPGWVWANSARTGYLENLNPEGGVPFNEKGLILGGQSTIRGFQPDEAFPNKYDLGVEPGIYRLTTSSTMYLLKSEIRFPVWGAIGGAVFYDGGAVFIKNLPKPLKDPYRDAVGFGLRYSTPVGAVSLDIGYKLDRDESRREVQWPIYFSIGTF
jgi:outer membrane protein insertion porin family